MENIEKKNDEIKKNDELMESNFKETVKNFDELNLKKELLRGIFGYGYELPTLIQQKAILPIIQGNNIIAQSQCRTGITATFSIGTIQLIDTDKDDIQCIILSPTRESANQIQIVYEFLDIYTKIKVCLLVGGHKIGSDIDKLKERPQVVIGTRGRIFDLIKLGRISLTNLKYLVIDEADEMFSKGILDNVKEIMPLMPISSHILLFSSTITKDVVESSIKILKDPIKILIKNEELIIENIKQYYIYLKKEDKLDILLYLCRGIEINRTIIIYCNTKKMVDYITEELKKKGHNNISSIHGNLKQNKRNRIIDNFRRRVFHILVATDLLARGIDAYPVSLVINYDFPKDKETYIHRIGRSRAFDKKGNVINFVTSAEKVQLEEIKKYYNTNIEVLPSDLSEIK